MHASIHLPDPATIGCRHISIDPEGMTITASSRSSLGTCPVCAAASSRVHSFYRRELTDLPGQGIVLRVHLEVRRFFCDNPTCPRHIFVERFPRVAAVRARKTLRLAETLRRIGFALGGEAGSRLAGDLGMPTSADTMLRLVRQAPEPAGYTPRVLGMDDWAWRRGSRYGTILCDLERRRPIDLLPDRSSGTVAVWLRNHPGIRIIGRDRSGDYAQASRTGAPEAVQVADRWHLRHNLREALVRMLDRCHRDLYEVARSVAATEPSGEEPAPVLAVPEPPRDPTREQSIQQARRTRRLERYQEVMDRHHRGESDRAIARQMGLHRVTVAKYVHAGVFPERVTRSYDSRARPFTEVMERRWAEGCHNAAQIARELKAMGFEGSYYVIRRWVTAWRSHGQGRSPLPLDKKVHRPSSHRMAGWLLAGEQSLRPEEHAFLEELWQRCPRLKVAAQLAREFADMVHDRRPEELESWIVRTTNADVPHELKGFAKGLQADYAAVEAGLTLPWSNGLVEGHVNRLKLIKRQMYGRAGFELLRQRVLHCV